jgi:CO dehydrogenase nickel-insertion accessory protein CooC1
MTEHIKNVAFLILGNKGGCMKSHLAACLYEDAPAKGKKMLETDTDSRHSQICRQRAANSASNREQQQGRTSFARARDLRNRRD